MVEVNLPAEISGAKLAYLLQSSMESSLVPRGYKVKSSDSYESYFPTGSTKLRKSKVAKTIEASRDLKNSNKVRWGWTVIYPSTNQNHMGLAGLNYGGKPGIDLKDSHGSFDLLVTELHVGANFERYVLIEPGTQAYKDYKGDVQVLLDSFYKQLKASPVASKIKA